MDDAQAVVQAALAGLGVIMATDWLVGRELAEGRLVQVLARFKSGLHARLPDEGGDGR
jgi:DNA-binding transcriptional LysR family regulator